MRPTHKNRSRNRHRPTGSGGGGGSNNGGGNPLTRVYESNGPDVKVRGNAQTIAEKYLQLGRDAQSSSDIVMAESYFQHAEHYLRIVSAAQAYNQQNQPQQFRRQDEEFDDEDGEEGSDSQGNDTRGQQQPDSDGMGDQPVFEAEQRQQPQPQQHNQQNYRQQRDNRDQQGRDQNRDQGRDYNRDQNREQPRDQNRDQGRDQNRDNNGQPYQPRERFNKPRWQDRRDQNNQGQNPQGQQGGEPRPNTQYQPQPPRNEEQPRIIEAAAPVAQPVVAAPVAAETQWEAPSFLMRPAPTPPAERAPEAPSASEAAPAPAKRKYERKPRKEAVVEAPPVTEPVSE